MNEWMNILYVCVCVCVCVCVYVAFRSRLHHGAPAGAALGVSLCPVNSPPPPISPLTGLEDGKVLARQTRDVCERRKAIEVVSVCVCVCVCDRGLSGKSLMYVALMDPKSFETVAPEGQETQLGVHVTVCVWARCVCLLNSVLKTTMIVIKALCLGCNSHSLYCLHPLKFSCTFKNKNLCFYVGFFFFFFYVHLTSWPGNHIPKEINKVTVIVLNEWKLNKITSPPPPTPFTP